MTTRVNFGKPLEVVVAEVLHDVKLVYVHFILSIHFHDDISISEQIYSQVDFTKATLADLLLDEVFPFKSQPVFLRLSDTFLLLLL